jgi:hypothetical protein
MDLSMKKRKARESLPMHRPPSFPESAVKICGSAGGSELVCNVIECRGSACSDRGNGCDTYNDDQGEHDSIFNCSWAIFTLQESLQLQGEILHYFLQTCSVSPSDRHESTLKLNLALSPQRHVRCRHMEPVNQVGVALATPTET